MSDAFKILELWQIQEYMGVSGLRQMNAENLRKVGTPTLILADSSTPVAVIMPYHNYLAVQRLYNQALELAAHQGDRE